MWLAVFAQSLPVGKFAGALPVECACCSQAAPADVGVAWVGCQAHLANVAAAHQGLYPKPTNVVDGLPLSHQPNPATEETAGKTPIYLNEMRIRPSETSFQFIS